MIIYNFQKEFIGIDEKDLISLGFRNLAELKTEISDFSDLFVKTPGYIHNFKHVHWIDFITCSESYEESKVIINVKNKNYKASLIVNTLFLADNPSKPGFIVTLNNLRELAHSESEAISNDIIERPNNNFEVESKDIFNTPEVSENFNEIVPETILVDPYESIIEVEEFKIEQKLPSSAKIEVELEDFDTNNSFIAESIVPVAPIENLLKTPPLYTFDPSVASKELGLPRDLIEEFIQDFIIQAKEFKEEIYASLDNSYLEKVKILSHKLKGVAANLRVEDSLEYLTIINSSSEINILKENLDLFYISIANLAGEKIAQEPAIGTFNTDNIDMEEELILSFKDDEVDDLYSDPDFSDAQVPQKIEIAELADDTFVPQEITQEEIPEPEPELEEEEEEEEEEVLVYVKATIANEIGLDIESFKELFNDYLHDSHLLCNSIKKAMNTQDFSKVQAEALRLKGMSDNMRINFFSQELETIIRTTNSENIAAAIYKIEANLAQLSKSGV